MSLFGGGHYVGVATLAITVYITDQFVLFVCPHYFTRTSCPSFTILGIFTCTVTHKVYNNAHIYVIRSCQKYQKSNGIYSKSSTLDCSLGVISQSNKLSCIFECTRGKKYVETPFTFFLRSYEPLSDKSNKTAWFNDGDLCEFGDFSIFDDFTDFADFAYFISAFTFSSILFYFSYFSFEFFLFLLPVSNSNAEIYPLNSSILLYYILLSIILEPEIGIIFFLL